MALASELAGVALLASAGALIGWSAQRPSWLAIAGLLLVVELLAFLRAPLRHLGQLAAHGLSTEALSTWRHRLLLGLAASVRRLGSPVASGDALERLTAEAQLAAERAQRVELPRMQATAFTLLAIAISLASSPTAAVLLATGALAVAMSLRALTPSLAAAEAELAAARRKLATRALESFEARVELGLLGAGHFLDQRNAEAIAARELAARRLRRTRSLLGATVAGLSASATLGAALLLGSRCTPLAIGALVVAVGGLEAAGLATAATVADGPSRSAEAAIESLPEAPAGRVAGPPIAGRPLLEARGISVVAEDGEALLQACDLLLERGETVAVVGPSGAGKSTLLAALAGIAPLASGSSSVAGVALAGLRDGDRARLVAYVGHDDGILPGSVRDALQMGRRDLDDATLRDALDAVGLSGSLQPRGGLDLELEAAGANLSTGERRRLAVARALATGAEVWLLDEPAAGLDPAAANRLGEVIARLAAQRAVVVVTHRDEDAARATRRLEVRDGQLLA